MVSALSGLIALALIPGSIASTEGPVADVPAVDVVINEIIYDEISGFSDRIELYNAGSSAANLTGWRFSDDKRDRFGDVPVNTVLEPGEYAVLVQDVDFSFGLGKEDEIVLYSDSGVEVDNFQYTNIAPIAVWARCPDGSESWQPATVATPGAANDCSVQPVAGAVRLNEIDSEPADWVELFNPGTEDFDISGYELRDNSDDHRWQVAAGTVLSGGEYLTITSDTVGVVGGLAGTFGAAIGLGSTDQVRLFTPGGEQIDDSGTWDGHPILAGAEATIARCPDGLGDFRLARATPGSKNSCVMPDVAINEIESNGDATDWVEILNFGAAPIDISGWKMLDNDPAGHSAETTPVPSGTILAAGDRFVFDQPGQFTFGLGSSDSVAIFDGLGNVVSEHAYPAHAAGVWGRCPEGTGEFRDLSVSTKGLRNACGNPVRVNEVDFVDNWIELFNPTSAGLDVSAVELHVGDSAVSLPVGLVVPANGYAVLERAQLGLDLPELGSVSLVDGELVVDDTSWAERASTSWGRCPDATGPFAVTEAATKGTINRCIGEPVTNLWPGSEVVEVVDKTAMFLADSSGLDSQHTENGNFLWAVDNGTGRFWKLEASNDGTAAVAPGWEAGKRARFQRDADVPGAAGPDAEGVTVAGDGLLYIASERDNSAKSVNQNTVLQIDPEAAGPDIVASREWDLTALLPSVGANLGMEAVEWVPDNVLADVLIDDQSGVLYRPSDYPGHGEGLFFVAIEDGGGVFGFALNNDGTADLVSTIDPGMPAVMALDYDATLGGLWAVCDDGCDGELSFVELNGSATPEVTHYARPGTMPNLNNEGFATGAGSMAEDGSRPVWWFADGLTVEAMRSGRLNMDTPVPPTQQPPVEPTPSLSNGAVESGADYPTAGRPSEKLAVTGAGGTAIGIGAVFLVLAGGFVLYSRRRRSGLKAADAR